MTNQSLTQYLANLSRQTDLKTGDIDKHVAFCVEQGKRDLWEAYPWHCRCRTENLTLTGEATNLPDDFEMFRSFRDANSLKGLKLTHIDKSEFDRKYPKPSSFSSASGPVVCSCYQDDGRWKVAIVPVVTRTLILDYFVAPPADVSGLPNHLYSGLVIAAARYLWAPGTTPWWSASNAFNGELIRIQRLDGPVGDMGSKFLDDTEQMSPEEVFPWMP